MSGFQIGDSSNLNQRVGHVDGRVSKLASRVDLVGSEVASLRASVRSLNEIVAALRVQLSDLRRSELPDAVFTGLKAPGERHRR